MIEEVGKVFERLFEHFHARQIHDAEMVGLAPVKAAAARDQDLLLVQQVDEFMLAQIDKILDDISVQISEKNEYLPEAVQKLLEAMEYDVPYTSKALMEKLGLSSKEGFRRNYLHPSLKMNLIQMTIPDKPNSRNQRYVKS